MCTTNLSTYIYVHTCMFIDGVSIFGSPADNQNIPSHNRLHHCISELPFKRGTKTFMQQLLM